MATEVYYLGPPGTFGEQAVLSYLRLIRRDLPTTPLSSHDRVIQATGANPDGYGVVAVENSLGGGVSDVMDAILAAKSLFVCGEVVVPIEHCLIAAAGTKIQDVSVVMSHPQALAQCHDFLHTHLPDARLDASLSTVAGVEEALRTPGAAAIAAKRAAELQGGEVLAASIQDEANDKTRFFVLGHTDAPPTGDDKTSIAFNVADRPGSLVSVMRHLSDRGLNLTRIESRPSREELGKYVFLIDFQGHRTDPAARDAIEAMRASGAVLLPAGEPLGSYPRFHARFHD
jgi:prephenate dehydratase